jgi:hypothetical protein
MTIERRIESEAPGRPPVLDEAAGARAPAQAAAQAAAPAAEAEHAALARALEDRATELAARFREIAQLTRALEAGRAGAAEAAAARAAAERRAAELEAERDRLAALLETERATAADAARRHARQLAQTEGALARTQAELARLWEYGRQLEAKYAAVLESETWRAMEPVRRALRALKRRPTPKPFAPRLRAPKPPVHEPAQTAPATEPLLGFDPRIPRSETMTVFLATFPARQANLSRVVAALLPQCDVLRVYLNEYDFVPDCLRHEKIRPTLGRDAQGDLKDSGKFFSTGDHPEGYHVFVDDDIAYPPDYVERIVAGVRRFGFHAVVGFHGTIYKPPLESYIRDRIVQPFYAGSRSAVVDQLGTGTVGYHTSTFVIDLSAFETVGLADLWFARRAAERGVPLVALERSDNWLGRMEEVGDTLFRQAQRDESRETALLVERLAPVLRDGPRARLVGFLNALYTPEHLKRSKLNLELSMTGAFVTESEARSDVHFALVVAGWNCAAYVEKCFASIARQVAGGYTLEIYAYDDRSDDETWERLSDQAATLRIRRFRGERNMGPAFARDFLLRQIEGEDTICVLLDMDDELLPHALATLERAYRETPDCWMTYGNWVNQNGAVNDEGLYAPEDIDERAYRRQDVFKFTHLRSFRRFLYDRVTPEHLKDADGAWLRYCSDVALMLPIADQCASKNVVAFEAPLYRYNQYRSTGTQKRFGGIRKKETFRYLRATGRAVEGPLNLPNPPAPDEAR